MTGRYGGPVAAVLGRRVCAGLLARVFVGVVRSPLVYTISTPVLRPFYVFRRRLWWLRGLRFLFSLGLHGLAVGGFAAS